MRPNPTHPTLAEGHRPAPARPQRPAERRGGLRTDDGGLSFVTVIRFCIVMIHIK
jgi:hypothetical protein